MDNVDHMDNNVDIAIMWIIILWIILCHTVIWQNLDKYVIYGY